MQQIPGEIQPLLQPKTESRRKGDALCIKFYHNREPQINSDFNKIHSKERLRPGINSKF